jgi:hypothetical protein
METIAALQELSHSKSGKGELATRASRYWAGERFVGSSLEYCQWQAATTMSEIRNLHLANFTRQSKRAPWLERSEYIGLSYESL